MLIDIKSSEKIVDFSKENIVHLTIALISLLIKWLIKFFLIDILK